jgi:hypothetical protein
MPSSLRRSVLCVCVRLWLCGSRHRFCGGAKCGSSPLAYTCTAQCDVLSWIPMTLYCLCTKTTVYALKQCILMAHGCSAAASSSMHASLGGGTPPFFSRCVPGVPHKVFSRATACCCLPDCWALRLCIAPPPWHGSCASAVHGSHNGVPASASALVIFHYNVCSETSTVGSLTADLCTCDCRQPISQVVCI